MPDQCKETDEGAERKTLTTKVLNDKQTNAVIGRRRNKQTKG